MLIYGTVLAHVQKSYISTEPPVATFAQLKPILFVLREYFGSLKSNALNVYIFLKYLLLKSNTILW